MNDKKVLTICPCCKKVAIGNGRSNVVCPQCGFAFIVHDEAKRPRTYTEEMKDMIKNLSDLIEAARKAGFNV